MFGFGKHKKRKRKAKEYVNRILESLDDNIKASIYADYFYCSPNVEQELLILVSEELKEHHIKIWYGLATSCEALNINNAPCIYWEYANHDSSSNSLYHIWRYDNYVSHSWGKIELIKAY